MLCRYPEEGSASGVSELFKSSSYRIFIDWTTPSNREWSEVVGPTGGTVFSWQYGFLCLCGLRPYLSCGFHWEEKTPARKTGTSPSRDVDDDRGPPNLEPTAEKHCQARRHRRKLMPSCSPRSHRPRPPNDSSQRASVAPACVAKPAWLARVGDLTFSPTAIQAASSSSHKRFSCLESIIPVHDRRKKRRFAKCIRWRTPPRLEAKPHHTIKPGSSLLL